MAQIFKQAFLNNYTTHDSYLPQFSKQSSTELNRIIYSSTSTCYDIKKLKIKTKGEPDGIPLFSTLYVSAVNILF